MENTENIQIGGYIHHYIKNKEVKSKFIPVELKDAFIERFGNDLLNTDEDEMDEFIKNSKQNEKSRS